MPQLSVRKSELSRPLPSSIFNLPSSLQFLPIPVSSEFNPWLKKQFPIRTNYPLTRRVISLEFARQVIDALTRYQFESDAQARRMAAQGSRDVAWWRWEMKP
jgi:hypothetical protein